MADCKHVRRVPDGAMASSDDPGPPIVVWGDAPQLMHCIYCERETVARLTAEVERLMGEKTRSGHYARGRADERQAVVEHVNWLIAAYGDRWGCEDEVSALTALLGELAAGVHVKESAK